MKCVGTVLLGSWTAAAFLHAINYAKWFISLARANNNGQQMMQNLPNDIVPDKKTKTKHLRLQLNVNTINLKMFPNQDNLLFMAIEKLTTFISLSWLRSLFVTNTYNLHIYRIN